MRTMMASAWGRWICSRASEWATTAMSAATPHSCALSARVAACAFPGRRVHLSYCALPVPLLEPLVAVSLEGAVRGEASPGPAVVPVLPEPLGVTALPELVAPPEAAPRPLSRSL